MSAPNGLATSWRQKTGPGWEDHDLVFPGTLGQPLDWHNVSQRAFKEILSDAKLPESFSPYALRHTCATLLLAAGEPSKVIAERLGHSTTAITDDVYSHVLPGMQERATERLESLLYSGGQ
jgi:integrase